MEKIRGKRGKNLCISHLFLKRTIFTDNALFSIALPHMPYTSNTASAMDSQHRQTKQTEKNKWYTIKTEKSEHCNEFKKILVVDLK